MRNSKFGLILAILLVAIAVALFPRTTNAPVQSEVRAETAQHRTMSTPDCRPTEVKVERLMNLDESQSADWEFASLLKSECQPGQFATTSNARNQEIASAARVSKGGNTQ